MYMVSGFTNCVREQANAWWSYQQQIKIVVIQGSIHMADHAYVKQHEHGEYKQDQYGMARSVWDQYT